MCKDSLNYLLGWLVVEREVGFDELVVWRDWDDWVDYGEGSTAMHSTGTVTLN